MHAADDHEIQRLESELSQLQQLLVQTRGNVQSWVEANSALSRSAAEARAKNQASGRGFMGALLGAKFRSVMRAGAAASNASISKEVAKKRGDIAARKAQAQDSVAMVQAEIAQVKSRIREVKASHRGRAAATKARRDAGASVDLLHKLKEAHALGLLTDAEYAEKRAKLVSDI